MLVLFTLTFLSLWWNRFIGGTAVDTAFFYSSKQIVRGRIPYRDFVMSVPPLEALKYAALIATVGEYIVAPRAAGLIERLILSVLMFAWLARYFPLRIAAVAAAMGIILLSSGAADPMAGYNHSATFWAVAAGLAASAALDRTRGRVWMLLLSGILASCCLLTKQTIGLGFTGVTTVVVTLALVRLEGFRAAGAALLAFAAGWVIPTGAVLVWLWRNAALGPFIQLVFLGGTSSKGTLGASLARPLVMAMQDAWLRQELIVALLLIGAACFTIRRPVAAPGKSGRVRRVVISLAATWTVLLVGILLAYTFPRLVAFSRIDAPQRIVILATLCGSAIAVAFYSVQWLSNRLDRFGFQMWLLSAVAFAVSYMHSLSFVITEGMFLPGFPFLFAIALTWISAAGVGRLIRIAVVALSSLAVVFASYHKLMAPFNWYGWTEPPVSAAVQASVVPQLAGLRGAPSVVAVTDRLTTLIQEHSNPQDPVFLFFYLPLFNVLSDRLPPTYAFVHFIDVTSDKIAIEDARRILTNKPKVLVYTPVPEAELREWERIFRGSRPSGQREMIAAIESLLPEYELLDTLKMPGSQRPVRVYSRRQ